MSPRRAQAGFNLVELMIVVTIIGIGAALSASGVADAFSENRASRTARELVRIGRRARSDAMGYLRAYMVWVEPATNRVTLIRGWSASCTSENWNTRLTVQGCGAVGLAPPLASPCVEQVRFTDTLYSNDAYASRVDLVSAAGLPVATNVAICYTPGGQMFTQRPANLAAITPANFTADNAVNLGGVRFMVRRIDPDTGLQQGVRRLVFFPHGAPPRLER